MAVELESELLTVQEAAALLKVSSVTIKRYLKQGRLPGYHLGPRAVRIKREDLSGLLKAVDDPLARARQLGITIAPPTPEELARRRAIVDEILELREKASIAPLTTADLVSMSRDEDFWYGDDD
jgi:excisionase family DNA binding protein